MLRKNLSAMRMTGSVEIQHVRGHKGLIMNEMADRVADAACRGVLVMSYPVRPYLHSALEVNDLGRLSLHSNDTARHREQLLFSGPTLRLGKTPSPAWQNVVWRTSPEQRIGSVVSSPTTS